MIIHNVAQGSAEWLQIRCGIPTASEFSKILTPKKLELSSQSKGYMCRLLGEWMTGRPQEMIETEYMQIGRELEARAVSAYCFLNECEVEQIGFVTSDDGRVGCSPDRFVVGARGGLEIKTHPQAIGVHVQAMLERAMDDSHKAQVMGCLWLCEKEWWDLESYVEDLPTVVVRVYRDEKYIDALRSAMASFCDTMDEMKLKLTAEYGPFERRAPKPEDHDGLGITDDDLEAIVAERFPKGGDR